MEIELNTNKGFRLLNMYEMLNKGEHLIKAELANRYNVTEKTIQRDIDELRAYLVDTHFSEGEVSIRYDRMRSGYYLVRTERDCFINEEVLAVCKVLLESRAFCKDELNTLIEKLLAQITPNDRKLVENMIRNERLHYAPLRHGRRLLHPVWEITQYITQSEIIRISYTRQDNMEREHEVKPVAIIFSEFYFYLVAFMADDRHDFPTVFRIDRIGHSRGTGTHFQVPHKDKFNDGEFRKRVQFMYPGELRRVKFKYTGPSIEAVLDKLPGATVIGDGKDGSFLITIESYGNGIDMWLKSQGEWVEVAE